ncbi:MAG: hypothetical protein JW722_02335 [Demequinaceae bacterium]|nr:hypothetical protein [Demequinaceae bacterium]
MSDMIDRLRTISAGAGRDIATDLATPSTVTALAGRIQHGVRRRRIRMGAIGVSVAAVVGAAVIAAPTLLRSLPGEPETIQPGIVRAVGPITTYEDDSVSVVLSSGDLVSLPRYEGDVTFQRTSSESLCMVTSPAGLPSGSWTPVTPDANRIVQQVTIWKKADDGTKSSLFTGSFLGAYPPGAQPAIVATVQVDPAVAPFIAVKISTWEFKVIESDHGRSYAPAYALSSLEGEPAPVYSGSADLGTRVGTLETRSIELNEWGTCYKPEDLEDPSFRTGTFEWHVVVDVFLVDHKGGTSPLGTAAYWFESEMV